MLSSDIRTAFVQALLDPDKDQSHFAEVNMKEALYAQYSAAVTFTNDDLMLKTTEHNRPNYVIGEIDLVIVNRILLDLRIVDPLILALLIRPGFRSCVMAPVPLKGDSSFKERRGAALARRRLVFPLFFLEGLEPLFNIGSKNLTYPFFLERIREKGLLHR